MKLPKHNYNFTEQGLQSEYDVTVMSMIVVLFVSVSVLIYVGYAQTTTYLSEVQEACTELGGYVVYQPVLKCEGMKR